MTRTMKPSTILKRARKLIERGWCKGAYAMDARGRPLVNFNHQKACRWCASAALFRAGGENCEEPRGYFREAIGLKGIAGFNDSQTNKRPVLRAFDRAIALAVKEGK